MALLSIVAEMDRATPVPPFANGHEGQSWQSIWCDECQHERSCPLILVALMDKTPQAWEDRNPGALNRYHCNEFESTTTSAGGSGGETPTV